MHETFVTANLFEQQNSSHPKVTIKYESNKKRTKNYNQYDHFTKLLPDEVRVTILSI